MLPHHLRNHSLRNVYSLAGKAIAAVLRQIDKGMKLKIPIMKFASIMDTAHTFSLRAEDWRKKEWFACSKIGKSFKWDIGNFFCRVPRALIWRALDWMLCEFSKTAIGGRKVVTLPRAKFNLSHDYGDVVYSRSFHGLLLISRPKTC